MEVGPQSIRPIKHLKAPLGKFTLERFLSWIGVWKQCIKNRFSKMRKGYNVGAFMAQMLTSLSAWKANCAQWYLFSVFFFSAPFPHSLQPPSVRLSTELSCFSRLPSCLFPIVWIFLHLWFFPQLSLHPSLFPSASFSPGARWCSLITGARYTQGLATLRGLCEDQMCACVCAIRCVFDFLSLLRWKRKDDKSCFISSPFSESSPGSRCIFKEIWLGLKRIPLFADLDKCYHSN